MVKIKNLFSSGRTAEWEECVSGREKEEDLWRGLETPSRGALQGMCG